MLNRCRNQNDKDYPRYGGRGITVCERWNEFANFLADMGECPKGMTIDRAENAKGYEPGNCHWKTAKQQARNRRNNKLVTINGTTLTAAEWDEKSGFNRGTVARRVSRGWPEVELLKPVNPNFSRKQV